MSSITDAQLWKISRYELTGGIGTTQFFGDIGGFSRYKNILGIKDFSFRQTRFNITAAMKYRVLEDVSVRLNLAFGYFHSTDARGSNITRGFESSTLFFEPSISGEYYFIKNKGENSYTVLRGKPGNQLSFFSMLDVYAFTGIGGLSYKVKANEALASVMQKPSGFTAVLPVGVGATLRYSGNIKLGIELSGTYAFSDMIDGYTSPHSRSNDIFYMLTFNFIYKIKTAPNGLPSF
jgi:hypothetical protein